MLETLVWITAIICAGGMANAYLTYRDPFHPAMVILPMFAFIYVVMPLYQLKAGDLFTYVSEDKLVWVHSIVIAGLVCLIVGLHLGSAAAAAPENRALIGYRPEMLHRGAYILGSMGLTAWGWAVHNGGGITHVFGHAKGMGVSDFGFIREAAYLLIVAVLLLISPEGYAPKNKLWCAAVVCFSLPYALQGLLGAQRGPTFLIVVSLGMSWYLARFQRPSVVTMLSAALALGVLMIFLVTNRDAIYLGSQKK